MEEKVLTNSNINSSTSYFSFEENTEVNKLIKAASEKIIDGFCVIYSSDGIISGRLKVCNLELSREISGTLISARFFNNHREMKIWKSGNKFQARIIDDTQGKTTLTVDSRHLIYGTDFKSLKEGFTTLLEARGVEFSAPIKCEVDTEKRLYLLTRNYLNYTNNGLVNIYDSRFLEFKIFNLE